MSFSGSKDQLDEEDRRDSFVSEDLDGPSERPEARSMQERVGDSEGGDQVLAGVKSSTSTSFAVKDQSTDAYQSNKPSASPRQPLSDRYSPLTTANDSGHDLPQRESPSESVSSSVLATPHQPVSDHFDAYKTQGSKRNSADSSDGFQRQPKVDHAKGLSINHPSTLSNTEVVNLDEVCPLDTQTSAISPKPTSRPEPTSPTSSADASATSPRTSPLKSKLSLIPSAIGYAAGLLPLARSTSTSNAEILSSPKSASFPETEDKSDATSPGLKGVKQLPAGSDTSSIHSAKSTSLDVKDDPTVPAPGPSSWRSLTNFLARTSTAPVQESAATPTPGNSKRATAELARHIDTETPATSLLLHHITSPSATADRRRSLELGGPQQLREGFERVKAEMVGAAKELRDKDARSKRDSGMVATTALSPLSEMSELASDTEGTGGTVPSEALSNVDSVDWQFWGAVMSDYEEVARTRPKDLSRAIQEGIPAVVRGTIWQLMSSSKSIALEATYSALLKLSSPHEKAIQKDLARTFPQHAYFTGTAGGQESLFNVVKAYSIYDQDVGYTQGLAFIVAALLLNMPEEEAFCVLIRLMYSYDLRSHFLPDMPGLQLRMYQFDRLLEELLPALHLHLVRAGVKSSMYASQWFMTMFSYRFPLCLVYRIFDIVFAEGVEAIFRFSMALMRKNEDRLLKLDFEGILKFLTDTIFECYKNSLASDDMIDPMADIQWLTNDFVCDAYAVQITPFMLDSFSGEWEGQLRVQNARALELDTLRNANRNLSNQVKQLESAVATMNAEHVEIVKELVESRIERESVEAELVRYKLMYADLSHEQQNAMSRQSRMSSIASTR